MPVFPAFMAQYAAGCFLAVAASRIRLTDWRYVRLMCIVSTAIALLAMLFQFTETRDIAASFEQPGFMLLAGGLLSGFIWLFINAAQAERIRSSQHVVAGIAGVICLVAAFLLAAPATSKPISDGAVHVAAGATTATSPSPILLGGSVLLGAGLLGVATTAMLLGHRYLTDTGMSIAPLMWITRIYLGLIALRWVWVVAAGWPLWTGGRWPAATAIYFWLALSVRVGVGLIVAGVFAYMIWDCVRRRATQSATALYYLSMLFIFSGELTAQYLLRMEGLTL